MRKGGQWKKGEGKCGKREDAAGKQCYGQRRKEEEKTGGMKIVEESEEWTAKWRMLLVGKFTTVTNHEPGERVL